MSDEKQLTGKDKLGRFLKGNNLSKGRKKGSKNKATLVRERMRETSNLMLGAVDTDIMKKALEMALDGDRELLKMFTKTMMGDGNEKGKAPQSIEVVINNLAAKAQTEVKHVTQVDVETVPLEDS